jgi:hypothetical protein
VDRDDSTWHSFMRLLRQKTRGGWNGVMERVRQPPGE